MDVRFCESRNHGREAHRRAVNLMIEVLARSSAARVRSRVFSLNNRLTWMSAIRTERTFEHRCFDNLRAESRVASGNGTLPFWLRRARCYSVAAASSELS